MVRKSCPPPCAAQQRYGEVGKNPRLSLAFFMPPVLHRMTAFFLIRRHKDVKTPFSLTASFSTQREKTDSIQIISFIYVKNTTFIRLLRFFMLTDLGQKTRFHRAGHLFPTSWRPIIRRPMTCRQLPDDILSVSVLRKTAFPADSSAFSKSI